MGPLPEAHSGLASEGVGFSTVDGPNPKNDLMASAVEQARRAQ